MITDKVSLINDENAIRDVLLINYLQKQSCQKEN